jgi:hypothetical protein
MAFTSTQLADAEAQYARMTIAVRHGDKSVSYADLDAQWEAIERMRRALASPAQPSYVRLTSKGY